MMATEQVCLLRVIKAVPRFNKYAKFYQDDMTFRQKRNEIMAVNIMRYIEKYPGKKMVVLTWVFHKYYLFNLLHPLEENKSFQLVEFFE
jgi:hypothetical protein